MLGQRMTLCGTVRRSFECGRSVAVVFCENVASERAAGLPDDLELGYVAADFVVISGVDETLLWPTARLSNFVSSLVRASRICTMVLSFLVGIGSRYWHVTFSLRQRPHLGLCSSHLLFLFRHV